MPIDWRMFEAPDVGKNAMDAFREGEKIGRELRVRKAMGAFAANPDDPEPINALIALGEPEKALSLHNLQAKRAEATRDNQYRGAQARYFGGGNALAAAANPTSQTMQPDAPNALAGFASPRPAPVPGFKQGVDLSPGQTVETLATQVGNLEPEQPHPLGQPQSPEDSAFMEMLSIDPKRAFETKSAMRDEAVKRLGVTSDAYDFAISHLANVQDDAGYQTVLGEMDTRLKPLGVDIRTLAPPQFPGPQGVRALLMKALGAKDQLAAIVSRDRLETYRADIDADNKRADLNTRSLIDTRQGNLKETRRFHGDTIETRKRGQDISAATSRRGQDSRGGGKTARPTATGPDGKSKVEWDGKAWIPLK